MKIVQDVVWESFKGKKIFFGTMLLRSLFENFGLEEIGEFFKFFRTTLIGSLKTFA